ncbi:hypothetical protein GCM10009839_41440 [Catenulispora yoronensis]|uniref:Novel STAND NTPase 1 domain-containing protein n=1 Tax=Catenulispora yoronensis TaxID=450799 RepID=A0ABN2UHE6_9ACTN
MTPSADAPPGRVSRIDIIHAGADVVWAQWLRQVAVRAGIDARVVLAHPLEPLAGRIALAAESGRVAVPVVTATLIGSTAPAEGWNEARRMAEARGVQLLAVICGTTAVPEEAVDTASVNLRDIDEETARRRFLGALGADTGRTVRTTPLGEAALPPVRFPGHRPASPPLRVPVPPGEWFFGRDAEIETLRRRLDEKGQVAVSGASGSGKSWLAAEYLHRYASQYDVVAWIRAESSAMIREDLGRLAGLLGVSEKVEPGQLHQAVADALRTTELRCLLVLDDAVPHYHIRNETVRLVLHAKPVVLTELFPIDGRAHIVYTTVSGDWDFNTPVVKVPPFTEREGCDFLRSKVPGLSQDEAARLTDAAGGSPVVLHKIAHDLGGGHVTAGELLQLLSGALLPSVIDVGADPRYDKPLSTLFNAAATTLTTSPDEEAKQAVQLVKMLTFFAPETLPLDLLTSQMDRQDGRTGGRRLPPELALVLRPGPRRRKLLDYVDQYSLAQRGIDHDTGSRVTLAMHRLVRDAVRGQLTGTEAERYRHIVHNLLVDADPQDPRDPAKRRRYLQLWRQLLPSDALSCRHVAEGQSCEGLPILVAHIVNALRDKGELTAAAELGQDAAQAWSDVLQDDPSGLPAIQIETASALWQLNRADEAYVTAAVAQASLADHSEYFPEDFVRATNLVAAGLRLKGDWRGAVPYDEQAYALAREQLGPDAVATIRAGHNLSVAYHMMGRFQEALELDQDTYQRCRHSPALGERNSLTLHSVNNIARDHRELGAYEQSARMQENTVTRMMDILGDRTQQHVLRARKNLAVCLHKAGDYERAVELSREVLADHVRAYGPRHFETVAAITNLANDLRMTGDLPEARDHAETAHRTAGEIDAAHPFTALCALNLAAVLRALGDADEARRLDEQAIATLTGKLGEQHRFTVAARVGLARDLALAGDLPEAIAEGTRTLEELRAVYGPEHPYTLQGAANLSLDLRAAARTAEADELERQTVTAYHQTLGERHPESVAARERVKGDCDVEPPPM